jgi:hypothetical protein
MRSSLQARTTRHRHPSARPRYPRSRPVYLFCKNELKANILLKCTHFFHKNPSRPLTAIKSKTNCVPLCLPPANPCSEEKTSYKSQINPLICRRTRAHFRSRAPSRGGWPSHSSQKKPNHQQETTHIVVGRVFQRPGKVPRVSHRVH